LRLAAQPLDVGAAGLRLEPALDGTFRRLRLAAWRRWRLHRLQQQLPQTLARILPVALLAAETIGRDHPDPFLRQPASGQPPGIGLDAVGERGRAPQVEEGLNGGRNLLDVLAAGPARQHELLRQLPAGDGARTLDVERSAGHGNSFPGRSSRYAAMTGMEIR